MPLIGILLVVALIAYVVVPLIKAIALAVASAAGWVVGFVSFGFLWFVFLLPLGLIGVILAIVLSRLVTRRFFPAATLRVNHPNLFQAILILISILSVLFLLPLAEAALSKLGLPTPIVHAAHDRFWETPTRFECGILPREIADPQNTDDSYQDGQAHGGAKGKRLGLACGCLVGAIGILIATIFTVTTTFDRFAGSMPVGGASAPAVAAAMSLELQKANQSISNLISELQISWTFSADENIAQDDAANLSEALLRWRSAKSALLTVKHDLEYLVSPQSDIEELEKLAGTIFALNSAFLPGREWQDHADAFVEAAAAIEDCSPVTKARRVLGLTPGQLAPVPLKQAFREKSKTHHPDMGGSTEAFAALTDAHRVLKKIIERESSSCQAA